MSCAIQRRQHRLGYRDRHRDLGNSIRETLSSHEGKSRLLQSAGTTCLMVLLRSILTNEQVIGTDISLIQPTHNTPPNCEFVREDAEDMWIFGHLFDYIHWRLMFSCCTFDAS